MALQQYIMPSDARRDAHLPDTTLVEGYVVEHALRWKSNSVAGYLNAGDGIDAGGGGAGAPADVAQFQRAPKVSVTLSEYLSAASPHADPSCDFGWFTPSASASSLPAAENSVQEGLCFPAPPSPSAYPSSLPWQGNRVEVESTHTASLSPESIVLGGGSGSSRSSTTAVHEANGCANSGRGKNLEGDDNTPPPGGFDNSRSSTNGGSGSLSTRNAQLLEQHLALAPGSNASSRTSCNVRYGGGIGGRRGGDCSGEGAAGQRSIVAPNAAAAAGAAASSTGSMGVRLLPVKKARSTTTHLNSWHTLYPTVSSSGRLSAASWSGRCTMHIRRTSFPISTRHFPEEKPPSPNKRRSDRIAGGGSGSSWGSGRPLNGSPLLHGRGRDGAAAAAAATIQKEEQQQQESPPKASRPKSYSWAVTEIRVVRPDLRFPLGPAPAYAEYLVVVCMGREKLVAGWRRASDFEKLAGIARKAWMPK
ncbi:unnamed protein product, partial [Ectocarpus fasciculatus]